MASQNSRACPALRVHGLGTALSTNMNVAFSEFQCGSLTVHITQPSPEPHRAGLLIFIMWLWLSQKPLILNSTSLRKKERKLLSRQLPPNSPGARDLHIEGGRHLYHLGTKVNGWASELSSEEVYRTHLTNEVQIYCSILFLCLMCVFGLWSPKP